MSSVWQSALRSEKLVTDMRMEEDGGHAVTISLATSLNGEVQAGGDPWQVVRGCQKVVAHLGRGRIT